MAATLPAPKPGILTPIQWLSLRDSIACLAMLLFFFTGQASGEGLPLTTYTTANGLSQDRVKRIKTDSHGFLWFCTEDSFCRFDGYSFKTYGTAQGFGPHSINDVLETKAGTYWVATNGEGVFRFDPFAPCVERSRNDAWLQSSTQPPPFFTRTPVGSDNRSNRVNALVEDSQGNIWAGTDNGLYVCAPKGNQFSFERVELPFPGPPESYTEVMNLLAEPDGRLWVSTTKGLLQRTLTGALELYPLLGPGKTYLASALYKDRNGKLWVGYQEGILVLDPAQNAPVAPVFALGPTGKTDSNEFRDIVQSFDGHLWVASINGLLEFEGTTLLRTYTTENGLSDNVVFSVAQDTAGNIWLGTNAGGAQKISRNGFRTLKQVDGLTNLSVHSFFEDKDGELYIVSGPTRVHRVSQPKLVPLAPPQKEADFVLLHWNRFRAHNVLQDHNGEWWIGSDQNLTRFPAVSFDQLGKAHPVKVYGDTEGFGKKSIVDVFETRQGDIWVLRRGKAALSRWDRKADVWTHFTGADGVPTGSSPFAFAEDRSGNVWIGLRDAGLLRFHQGKFEHFTQPAEVLGGKVFTLLVDHSGRLWVGGSLGLSLIENPAAKVPLALPFLPAKGFSSQYIIGLTEDRLGFLYVATARGIDRLDPHTGSILQYTMADGLSANEAWNLYCDRKGRVWVGTVRGASWILPQNNTTANPPSIFISGLRIAGIQYPVSDLGESSLPAIQLEAGQNRIQIDFFGLSFQSGDVLKYEYRFRDREADWNLTTQRTVNLASLAPGTYYFEVRAVNSRGTVSAQPASVTLVIWPPLWQRWWFLTLVTAGTGGLLFGFYRSRIRRLLERERLRMRIAADLHDDIGSTLSHVSILSAVATQAVGEGDTQVTQLLARISQSCSDAMDSMSDIVWAINPKKDNLRDLTRRMRAFAMELLTARTINCTLVFPDTGLETRLNAETRKHFFLIFKECTNNVAKHSKATHFEATLRLDRTWLELLIKDNGQGFDLETERDGNGLMTMQKRAAAIGGTLAIESREGQGTTVRLRVPTTSSHWF
ncbi:MAG: hypothetical protein K1Y36_16075 [Blastocatellia bacterium]|nr:hypothetical protein [Blastocatellia bacterium]